MLSPLLTDIAAGLGTQAKEIGFAASAYGVGVASAALLAAPQLGRWPKRGAIRIAFAVLARFAVPLRLRLGLARAGGGTADRGPRPRASSSPPPMR